MTSRSFVGLQPEFGRKNFEIPPLFSKFVTCRLPLRLWSQQSDE